MTDLQQIIEQQKTIIKQNSMLLKMLGKKDTPKTDYKTKILAHYEGKRHIPADGRTTAGQKNRKPNKN